MSYIGKYKAAIFVVMFFAACSTIFNVAWTENFRKSDHCIIGRSDGENSGNRKRLILERLDSILLFVLGLYLCSAVFNFIQGWIMTGITQKVCYQSAEKKSQQKINRMPMKYFESRTYGEVLVPYHQRCRYVGTGTEPEYYHDHYIRWRRLIGVLDDDAQYFTADDADCDL